MGESHVRDPAQEDYEEVFLDHLTFTGTCRGLHQAAAAAAATIRSVQHRNAELEVQSAPDDQVAARSVDGHLSIETENGCGTSMGCSVNRRFQISRRKVMCRLDPNPAMPVDLPEPKKGSSQV